MPIQTFSRAGNPADPSLLLTAIKAAVAGVTDVFPGLNFFGLFEVVVDKTTAWSAPQITAVQTAINGVPDSSPALSNQHEIDVLSTREKAIFLTMLDQINVIRAALPVPLGAISVAQAIAAIRAKAGTL